MRKFNISFIYIYFFSLLISTSNSYSKTFFSKSPKRLTPTIFADVEYGLTSYQSEIVKSNAIGTNFTYTLGAHIGEKKNLAVLTKTTMISVDYTDNESLLSLKWNDLYVRYRVKYVYLSVLVSNYLLEILKGTSELKTDLSILGNGYGGNAGVDIFLGRNIIWNIDANYLFMVSAKDLTRENVSMGERIDVNTRFSFLITKSLLHLYIGLRYQSYSVTLDSSYKEQERNAYVGVRANLYF